MGAKKTVMPEYLRKFFDKYKYVLLLCTVGLVLILIPLGKPASSKPEITAEETNSAVVLQTRLEELFSQIEGVGRVRILLTAKNNGETVYAYDQNKNASKSDGSASSSNSMTLVTVGGSGGDPVVVRVDAPAFSGAVVVCDGADNARVRLALTEALRSLTGITSDNIVIVKMK